MFSLWSFHFYFFMLHRAHFLLLPFPFYSELNSVLRRQRINCSLLMMLQVWNNCRLAIAKFLLSGESTDASLVNDRILARETGNLGQKPHWGKVTKTMGIGFKNDSFTLISNSSRDYFPMFRYSIPSFFISPFWPSFRLITACSILFKQGWK